LDTKGYEIHDWSEHIDIIVESILKPRKSLESPTISINTSSSGSALCILEKPKTEVLKHKIYSYILLNTESQLAVNQVNQVFKGKGC
jgi:hypothetical protein